MFDAPTQSYKPLCVCVCVLVEEGNVSAVEQSRALSCARKDAKAPSP